MGAAESVASKVGSLTSHCDPDLKCSQERGRAPEKTEKKGNRKKGRHRKAKRTGERQEEKERPITKSNHRGIRESARGTEKQREGESYFLWVLERERVKRAWSVCVRSVVQLINL